MGIEGLYYYNIWPRYSLHMNFAALFSFRSLCKPLILQTKGGPFPFYAMAITPSKAHVVLL